MSRLVKAFWLTCVFLAAMSAHAAMDLTLGGGASFGSGDAHIGWEKTSPYFTTELTFGAGDVIQIGPFVDYNPLKSLMPGMENGSVIFYGGVGRMGFDLVSDLFFDAKMGFTKTHNGSYARDTSFGFGFGVGYDLPLESLVSIRPHLGYRNLPDDEGIVSSSRNMVDVNILLSLSL